MEEIKRELRKVIVGQDVLIDRLLIGLLANGHVLLEGVPGLAKTKILAALTQCIAAEMNRIQFTPDLLPSDLIGTEVYRPQSGDFITRRGPVFTNLLLADEINRAPAKVQSALLQAMQERAVTIGEQTFRLPDPFLVLATQNPIENEGTYPLPEAQLDRFLMKVKVDYPSLDEEMQILSLYDIEIRESVQLNPVCSLDSLRQMRLKALDLHVDPKIDRYIVNLVHASRNTNQYGLSGMVDWGASPRASIALKVCARALAFIRGRDFVSPDEVKAVAADVLRHRIVTSFEAEARGISSDQIVDTLLNAIAIP